jgi:predicted nucleic acid-binding protein
MVEKYYLDTCIWLNLFKKEEDKKNNIQYWKITKDFIKLSQTRKGKIIVSSIVLKELYFTSKGKFDTIKKFFKESNHIDTIKTTPQDYNLARAFEKDHKDLSFYDYLHIAIASRLQIPLITRDKDLINFAKNHITVFKPEDLINK